MDSFFSRLIILVFTFTIVLTIFTFAFSRHKTHNEYKLISVDSSIFDLYYIYTFKNSSDSIVKIVEERYPSISQDSICFCLLTLRKKIQLTSIRKLEPFFGNPNGRKNLDYYNMYDEKYERAYDFYEANGITNDGRECKLVFGKYYKLKKLYIQPNIKKE